jgi:outer membrane protein OmpA-like peptidoglycan-associated protein
MSISPVSRQFIYLLAFLFLTGSISGQTGNHSKKALKLFEKAREAYEARNYSSAITDIEAAVAEDPKYADAYLLLGDINAESGRLTEAVVSYKAAAKADSLFYPPVYYIIANIQFDLMEYEDAGVYYRKFLAQPNQNPSESMRSKKNIALCRFRINAMQNPVPFNPVNLGDSINTEGFEYVNALSVDGSRLYLTRRSPAHRGDESFFYSVKKNNVWGMARDLGPPVNTRGDEGALCLSPDGSELFFAACSRSDSYGSCDIYVSKRSGTQWKEPVNLGAVANSEVWDSQPCLSSDGRTLYFASKRRGGKGSSDIWRTTIQADGNWSIPENLGDSINTPEAEMTPFIHPDGRTLYFASKGHPGMGGADLFVSRADVNGRWSKAKNLGYPINTVADDLSLVVSALGDTAFLSSDNYGGKGKVDIYSFLLPPDARPVSVSYVKGIVRDAKTGVKLHADMELSDLSTGAVVVRSFSDATSGEFLLSLPSGHDYALSVSRQGYLYYSLHFTPGPGKDRFKPEIISVELQPVAIGQSIILHNIFFDTDKYTLRKVSCVELDKLVLFLKANPKLKIEIGGHTDNEGSESYNLQLSAARANTVSEYLINHGIDVIRLSSKGYGETKPIDTNDTPEGKANNRRTEFKITG